MEARIEVWFNNGLFRAFPKVDMNSLERDGTHIEFLLGDSSPKHRAHLNLNNVNFLEIMKA